MQELVEIVGRSTGIALMAPPSDSKTAQKTLDTLMSAVNKKQKVSHVSITLRPIKASLLAYLTCQLCIATDFVVLYCHCRVLLSLNTLCLLCHVLSAFQLGLNTDFGCSAIISWYNEYQDILRLMQLRHITAT